MGGGQCLFEDKKRYILAPSVLSPNRSCLFREFPVVDFKKGLGLGLGIGTHDPRPTTTHAD